MTSISLAKTAVHATAGSGAVTTHDAVPAGVDRKLMTPGVWVLLALVAVGVVCAAWRFFFGLQSVTHLNQQWPWGLWIAIDVCSGVALAAGGFTSAALVYIFKREHFHVVCRPALLTAMLGYTFVGLGLMVDLGRYYNIWHPAWPTMWQGNSVLFEVAMCVMCYLTVLYLEFAPTVCEKFINHPRYPRLSRLCRVLAPRFERSLFWLIIAGVVLSCLHQSSLGNLMVIAPSKVHPLWWTPILALLFLLSAIAVGLPMVIFESLYASWALRLAPEMPVLSRLAKYIPPVLGLYLAFKIGDMLIRGSYVHLTEASTQSLMFIIELILGVITPLAMLLSPRIRRSPRWLLVAALLVVVGVVINRVNVFLIAYHPPYATQTYFPSIAEFAVTIGLVSLLIFLYRVAVTYLPVISHSKAVRQR